MLKTVLRSFVILLSVSCSLQLTANAVELVRLSESNWEEFVPQGKEVDAIYGDWVLRNDELIVVIADALPGRKSNMTTPDVGGCVIDLTLRDEPDDQLNVFYPAMSRQLRLSEIRGANQVYYSADTYSKKTKMPESKITDQEILFVLDAVEQKGKPRVQVEYRFADGDRAVEVTTLYTNLSDKRIKVTPRDKIRADGEFEYGSDETGNLLWAYDSFWGQAYGIQTQLGKMDPGAGRMKKSPPRFGYDWSYSFGTDSSELQPDESGTLVRYLFPAKNLFDLRTLAASFLNENHAKADIQLVDQFGPVAATRIDLLLDGKPYASGRTSSEGMLTISAPPSANYLLKVTPPGRKTTEHPFDLPPLSKPGKKIKLPTPGIVVAKITDASGGPIPCKVGFYGKDGTPDPNFGPDSAINGVKNLQYTHSGSFRVPIEPGNYEVFISHGTEYDAVIQELEVKSGEEAELSAKLIRTVDTTGWLSAEMHSHSTPSGDNTSSQRGRVLNLLAEHLEFIPCTEHNRISTYDAHLEYFGANQRVLTCPGMELTGRLLPINHQNAFPLIHRPRTQDGGGPLVDSNPEVQIERLAMWDNGSDKVVQSDHPNLVQMFGDRDMDGKPDAGFRKMFGFMDIVEVHPMESIFSQPKKLTTTSNDYGNRIFHWLQLLNLGYRIPGVVNTDAHYNFHGSGPLRNFIKSTTDNPSEEKVMNMCHAAEQGTLTMTNGPFMEVTATSQGKSAPVGGDLASDGNVSLSVRVQCPNWLDINRVQFFINGQPEEKLNFTRRTHPDMFADGVEKFRQSIDVKLESDAHLIVVAAGEGLQLGRVMGSVMGKNMPITVSNPIYIDTDDNGFQANGDMLGLPLPVEEK